ncbi:aminotransferase class I/II-fold pyridoxal phosphate-dependent enzyme, partial [Staphylococcus saprophyticus]|uniref:aminotransferase class I/II-fold pyridoxal phosphate-dependent enzyme n=1 Tax=Staphylococcus saprophyticus TaxID=29385 RepID=UPI0011A993B9
QLALLQHTNPKPHSSFPQQIPHYLFNTPALTSHPHQIIIPSSTQQLINFLTHILTKQQFIIQNPTYPPIKQLLHNNHIPYLHTPLNKTPIHLNYFTQTNNNIPYLTPSHQF